MIIHDLWKYYGDQLVFQKVTATIRPQDRIGLVGANGVGKTTLLKVLAGEESLQGGKITRGRNFSVGRLQQVMDGGDQTLRAYLEAPFAHQIRLATAMRSQEERLAALKPGEALEQALQQYAGLQALFEHQGGYDYLLRVSWVATGLGFSKADFKRSLHTFSGGERMRVNLGRLLLRRPSLLLLDEPTNHLDVEGIQWLEGFLNSYEHAFLVVSHDRYFLDKITSRIWELHNQQLYQYNGNYSQYLPQRRQRLSQLAESRQEQQQEKERLEAFIRKFGAGTRARQAQSLAKKLDKMAVPQTGSADPRLTFHFQPRRRSGRDIAFLEDIKKSYNSQRVLNGITAQIKRGQRIALLGPNGSGKSTLLKILAGTLDFEGKLRFGTGVNTAYFSQNISFDASHNVLEELYAEHRLDLGVLRSVLARFLFSGDDVFKSTTLLSGGEKNRLALAKLLLHRPNFLLLDEPTNYLDVFGREALENSLAEFDGTILFVSHDRYFIDKIANHLWILDGGKISEFTGNFTSFLKSVQERKEQVRLKASLPEKKGVKREKGPSKGQLEKERAVLEEEILALEERQVELEEKLASPQLYENEAESIATIQEYKRTEAKLSSKYELWEKLVDRL